MWFAFLGKNPLRSICADLHINDFQAQHPSQWQVWFVTPNCLCSPVNTAASRYSLKLGLLHLRELKGKICSLLADALVRCDLHTGKKREKYQYLHFKHDFKMSAMVHSSAFWLFHAFSSLLLDCTSIWVSLA